MHLNIRLKYISGLVALFLIFALLPYSVVAQDSTAYSFLESFGFFANADAGYSLRINKYGNSTYGQNIVYDSKNIQTLSFQANAGLLDRSLLTLDYTRAIPGTDFQHEAIATQNEKTYGLEKYDGVIVLDVLREVFAPDFILFQVILSTRFRYIQEITETTALVAENSIYPLSEKSINYHNQSTTNFINLPAGTNYDFKTDYTYQEISVSLPFVPIPPKYKNILGGIRLGYAHWEYKRPFSTTYLQLNGQNVVYNASLSTHALVFVLETLDPGSPGLHIDGNLSIGIDNNITSNFDWNQVFEVKGNAQPEDRKVSYGVRRWEANLRYIIDPKPNTNKGLNISLGASLYGYIYNIKEMEDQGDDNEIVTEIKNRDDFYRVWGLISFRF